MRKLVMPALLFSIVCVAVDGQNPDLKGCPSFEVIGPIGPLRSNEQGTFTLSINSPELYKYVWKLSSGKIVSGQGTTSIRFAAGSINSTATGTVEIIGLPYGCPSHASETNPPYDPPNVILVEELEVQTTKLDIAAIEVFFNDLNDHPEETGAFIAFHTGKAPSVKAKAKIHLIKSYLLKRKSEVKNRVVFKIARSDQDIIKLYRVPRGADISAVD